MYKSILLALAINPFLAGAVDATAFAATDEAARPIMTAPPTLASRQVDLIVPVRIGSTILGDVRVRVDPSGAAKIDPASLARALEGQVQPGTLEQLRALPAVEGYVLPSQLTPLGIQAELDIRGLFLSVSVLGSITSTRSLSVTEPQRRSGLQTEAPSGVLSAIINSNYRERTGDTEHRLLLNGAARVGGVTFEALGRYEELRDDSQWVRERMALIYDRPDKLWRFEAGDLLPLARGFQSGERVGGLSWVRSRRILEPGARASGSLPGAFILDQESDVEVLVNGTAVRRARLQAGQYDLRDFPLAAGANQVEVRVLDDRGQVRVFSLGSFFDPIELDPNDYEFGLYLGAKESGFGASPRYDADETQISGFYRRNFNGVYTLGGYGSVGGDAGLVGGEAAINLVNGGRVRLDGAASYGPRTDGFGFRAEWDVYGPFDYERPDALTFAVEHRSSNFSSNPSRGFVEPIDYQIDARYSRRLTPQISAGVTVSQFKRGANDTATGVGLDADYFGSLWRAGVSIRYDGGARDEVVALFRLSRPLGRRSDARASYETSSNRAVVGYSLRSDDVDGGYGLDAELGYRDGQPDGALLANYQASRFTAGASVFRQTSDFADDADTVASVRLGSSIGFAGGHFGWGAPVTDGFAVLTKRATAQGLDVRIDPIQDRERANIRGGIPLVYPLRGAAYNETTVRLVIDDLAPGADPGPTSYTLRPALRQGMALDAGALPTVTGVFILKTQAGEPITMRAVIVRNVDSPQEILPDAFTNGRGQMVLDRLLPGRTYLLTVPSMPGTEARITLPNDGRGVVRLPPLEVTQ